MTNKLEGVIRPFTTGDIFNARVLPPVQPAVATPPDITTLFGNQITLQLAPNGITALFGGVKLSEVSRKTSTVRVENPADSSQFVDIQRIEQLTLKDARGQLQDWTLNNG